MKRLIPALLGVMLATPVLAQDAKTEIIYPAPQTERPAHWVGQFSKVGLSDRSGYCFQVDDLKGGAKNICSEERSTFQCLETLHKLMGDKATTTWIVYETAAGVSLASKQLVNKYLFFLEGETQARCTL